MTNTTSLLNHSAYTFINETTSFEEDYFFRKDVRIGLIIAYTFVFMLCFCGNLLVIIIVAVNRRMRTVTNVFLTNLAISDFCVSIFCIFQNLSLYLCRNWEMGNFMCKMYHFVQMLSYTTSVVILTTICVERYIAVAHPIWSKRLITARHLRFVVGGVWIFSALYCSPRLIMYGTIRVPSLFDSKHETLCVLMRSQYDSKVYDITNFVVCFVVPLTIITFVYCVIGAKLWKSGIELNDKEEAITSVSSLASTERRKINIAPSTQKLYKTSCNPKEHCVKCCQHRNRYNIAVVKSRRKVIRLLIAVVMSFALCNLPFHARKLWQYWSSSYRGASVDAAMLTIVTTLLLYLNSATNPIIYAFMSSNFRRSMIDALFCNRRRTTHVRPEFVRKVSSINVAEQSIVQLNSSL